MMASSAPPEYAIDPHLGFKNIMRRFDVDIAGLQFFPLRRNSVTISLGAEFSSRTESLFRFGLIKARRPLEIISLAGALFRLLNVTISPNSLGIFELIRCGCRGRADITIK